MSAVPGRLAYHIEVVRGHRDDTFMRWESKLGGPGEYLGNAIYSPARLPTALLVRRGEGPCMTEMDDGRRVLLSRYDGSVHPDDATMGHFNDTKTPNGHGHMQLVLTVLDSPTRPMAGPRQSRVL